MEEVREVAKGLMHYGVLFGLTSAASYCFVMASRIITNGDQYEENRKRLDPNASLKDRLMGYGYRPLHEGDTRVANDLFMGVDEKGNRVWKSKCRLSRQAIRSVWGSLM